MAALIIGLNFLDFTNVSSTLKEAKHLFFPLYRNDGASYIHSNLHSDIHSNIHSNIHSDIHSDIHNGESVGDKRTLATAALPGAAVLMTTSADV